MDNSILLIKTVITLPGELLHLIIDLIIITARVVNFDVFIKSQIVNMSNKLINVN